MSTPSQPPKTALPPKAIAAMNRSVDQYMAEYEAAVRKALEANGHRRTGDRARPRAPRA